MDAMFYYKQSKAWVIFHGSKYLWGKHWRSIHEWQLPNSWKSIDAAIEFDKWGPRDWFFKGNRYASYDYKKGKGFKKGEKLGYLKAWGGLTWTKIDTVTAFPHSQKIAFVRGNYAKIWNAKTNKWSGPHNLIKSWGLPKSWHTS